MPVCLTVTVCVRPCSMPHTPCRPAKLPKLFLDCIASKLNRMGTRLTGCGSTGCRLTEEAELNLNWLLLAHSPLFLPTISCLIFFCFVALCCHRQTPTRLSSAKVTG